MKRETISFLLETGGSEARGHGSALLIPRNPLVAHALVRAVFALLRTHVATEPKRSHECERGTQECVRHGTSSLSLVGQQAHGNSLTVAVRSSTP
jgi:hypothetical protein